MPGHIPDYSCFYTQICAPTAITPPNVFGVPPGHCPWGQQLTAPTAWLQHHRKAVLCSYLSWTQKTQIFSASKAPLRMSFLFGKSFMLHRHMPFWSPQVMKGGKSTLVKKKKMCKCKYQAQLVPSFSQPELKVWVCCRHGSAWGCCRACDVHSRGKHRQKQSLLCPSWLLSCQMLSTSKPSQSQESSQLTFSNSWKYPDSPPE